MSSSSFSSICFRSSAAATCPFGNVHARRSIAARSWTECLQESTRALRLVSCPCTRQRNMADIMENRQGGPTFLQALAVSIAREATVIPVFTDASTQAGAVSGLSVDFLFFPVDTIKTRQQSPQGFWAAGGFKGVYRGVGMVGAGSAPGCMSSPCIFQTAIAD